VGYKKNKKKICLFKTTHNIRERLIFNQSVYLSLSTVFRLLCVVAASGAAAIGPVGFFSLSLSLPFFLYPETTTTKKRTRNNNNKI
jgi:hypothetical protein